MLKKILGLLLAVIIAVCPVASFAEGESATTLPAENFNDGNISSWTAEGGSAVFSSDDYGYLKFTADEEGAVLSRDLGIESGAFTVDFKIKAESETGTATVSVGGAELALDFANKTLAGQSFIPKLWYNVRVVSDGSLYIDGVNVTTVAVNDFENSFKITADQACVIGIDDFEVYAEKKTDELTSTPLDFKFDDFTFTNKATGTKNYAEATLETENTKIQSTLGTSSWASTGQGNNPVNALNFSSVANITPVVGKFGKSTADTSAYINHTASDNKSYSKSTLDFNVGFNGRITGQGEKQAISFNMAFDGDSPEDLLLRSYGIYTSGGFLGTNAGYEKTNADIIADGGWLLKISGDKMYIFSNTMSYSIRPALLPGQWNNVRLEMEAGDAKLGSYTGSTDSSLISMYISVYVNDIAIAEDIAVAASSYYVQNRGTSVSQRGRFQGMHRIFFEYDWSNTWNTTGGIYLDDVKIENYYSGADYDAVKSPLLMEENGTLGVEEDGTVDHVSVWDHDKWVQGGVVYVDSEQTLASYVEDLPSDRNYGITFRNASGNIISDLNTTVGDITYAEIIRTDYSRIYVSLIGKNNSVANFAQNGSSTAAFGTWSNSTKNAWDTQNTTIVVSDNTVMGGKSDDSVLAFSPASGATSDFRTKYAFLPKLSNGYAYDSADDFRPVTVGLSVLMTDTTSTFSMGAWYAPGPVGSYVNESSTAIADGSKQNMIVSMKNGDILNQSGTSIGAYNANEWNRIEITFYPAYPEYRVDIHVNGETVAHRYIVKADSMYQAISWFLMQVTGNVYVDDLTAVTGYYKPEAPVVESSDKGVIDKLSSDTFLAASDKSVADITAALGTGRIYADSTYASEKTGNVATGDKLVVQNGAILKYFTINAEDFVREGNTVKALARSAGDKLYIGLYTDEAATTLDSIASATADEKGIFSTTIDTTGIEAIKGFLWNSKLVPYIPAKVVE